MATKVKIDYSQFRASGVYTLEFDASQNVILTSQTIRLVVGFSNKGPFNTPVYIPDVTTAIAIFGDIDRSLEIRGSFFQRSILTCLNNGPVFALNLLRLNDDLETANPDKVPYRSFSVDTEEWNGVVTDRLYASYYNKERFWYADPNYFLATLSIPDQGKILNLTNLGMSPMSIIVRKSTDANPPLKGYDIFAIDWYGANKVPNFMHPYDYMSDYFIDVIAVYGNWTNYQALSQNPKWAPYFTRNGFRKSMIDNFLAQPDVTIVTYVTGCIIPDFVDMNGVTQYIQTLINNNTASNGLFCAIDQAAFDNICANPSQIDLVGNNLIDELTGDRDLVTPRLDFLSYDQVLVADYLYTQNSTGLTGATGFVGPTGSPVYTAGMNAGTLFTLAGGTGGTAGVYYKSFATYDPNAYDAGLHYLQTGGTGATAGYFQTSTQLLALKDFLTVASSLDQKFIVGVVSGITAGTTGPLINQFSEANLVKLKVTGTKEISGNLRIYWTHPLDQPYYRSQGVTVKPTYNLAPAIGTTQQFYSNAYQFGWSDYFDITSVMTPTGITGPGVPYGYSNVLTGYSSSPFYLDEIYAEIQNGDIAWTNSAGTQVQYLGFQQTVDRDQFGLVYGRAYSNISRAENSIVNVANFGTTYASDNIGYPVSSYKWDLISVGASGTNSMQFNQINQFIDCTRIDTTNCLVTQDSNGNVPFSVGDYIVSTDLNICTPTNGNRQNRLTKVTRVAMTTTLGTYQVTTARPILYYTADSGLRVQKFQSIPQFTNSFDFTYLKGFTMTEWHRPNSTDARISEILDVMYTTNIAKTLAAKDVISFRYIVDTFSGQILPQSKYQLSRLAKLRQQALAIINAPSMAQFRASTDPRFTNAPTAADPYPKLNTQYIVDGGNLSLNPTYIFSLPSEDQGSKYAAFYSPYITIRETNRNVNVPPAALVSNNFLVKFANGEPYAIVAGQKRGVISGNNIVGVEYDFTDEDRGNLEPFGINPIIRRRGVGVVIYGNQTAYQQVNSAFNLVHVRDLLISIENDVQEILANYLFDFNEDSIRLEIKTLVDNYLDGVRAGGGIYAYQTIMDASNNTPAIIDMNMGIIDVIIEPARGIQKFINRITVTRTGGIASGGFIQFV